MVDKQFTRQRFLELALILISLALTCLLYRVNGYKMVVLNLFYLPVVLSAFFLGRYRAGVLALLCVISATVVTALDLNDFAAYTSPIAVALALTIWAAVLGLNAILVGTLSDERSEKLKELKDAYVGVVEVLSRYLNSADPRLQDRARRIADLSQKVAARMRLSEREIDDIRVAALLQDIENIEVTARVIRKAMGDLGKADRNSAEPHTFHGSDLVHSLGAVLTGALPLLFDHGEGLNIEADRANAPKSANIALGAKVICAVRSYDTLMSDALGAASPEDVLKSLRGDVAADHHPGVLHALEQVVGESKATHEALPYEAKPSLVKV